MKAGVEALQALVRPLVTLAFAGAVVVGWMVLGRLSDDAFLGLAGLVIGFWFQQRREAEKAPPPPTPPQA